MQHLCHNYTYWLDATTGKKKGLKKSIGYVRHMRWEEVYFDIMGAVGQALQGSISVSESVHTYSFPKPVVVNL